MKKNTSTTKVSIRVANNKELGIIQSLAEKIWPLTYGSILDSSQLDYMLKLLYNRELLASQLEEQHHVFLILDYESRPSGFASYSPYDKGEIWKLHKIYIDNVLQGNGLGKLLIGEVIGRVKAAHGKILLLNVNRHNKARFFYEKLGFHVIREEDIDIGNGYFMNDYVMRIDLVDKL